MRFPGVRFTVRAMIVAVAVAAVASATEPLRRRRTAYLERAFYHEIREKAALRSIPVAQALARGEVVFAEKDEKGEPVYVCGNIIRGIQESPVRWAYHARLRRKYERAARYPWLSVEPDPPPPY